MSAKDSVHCNHDCEKRNFFKAKGREYYGIPNLVRGIAYCRDWFLRQRKLLQLRFPQRQAKLRHNFGSSEMIVSLKALRQTQRSVNLLCCSSATPILRWPGEKMTGTCQGREKGIGLLHCQSQSDERGCQKTSKTSSIEKTTFSSHFMMASM